MRKISKIVTIPSTATTAQGEASLNTHLNDGWEFVGVFTVGTSKFWAVFTKTIAE